MSEVPDVEPTADATANSNMSNGQGDGEGHASGAPSAAGGHGSAADPCESIKSCFSINSFSL